MKKVKDLNIFTLTILSFFGIGFIPGSSGTYASAITAIMVYFAHKTSDSSSLFTSLLILTLVATYLISIPLIKKLKENFDQSYIVIDEFIGMSISLLPLLLLGQFTPAWLVTGFVLFRFFDIAKPSIIGRIDRSHSAISVLNDDVVAGIFSVVTLFALHLVF